MCQLLALWSLWHQERNSYLSQRSGGSTLLVPATWSHPDELRRKVGQGRLLRPFPVLIFLSWIGGEVLIVSGRIRMVFVSFCSEVFNSYWSHSEYRWFLRPSASVTKIWLHARRDGFVDDRRLQGQCPVDRCYEGRVLNFQRGGVGMENTRVAIVDQLQAHEVLTMVSADSTLVIQCVPHHPWILVPA
jgi:hypothetical protein